ncbi:hypothetical protein BZARG_2861 [Bizionia argentinensis JUB59]|uniref:Lipocalin-like domain-containing protein n=1 Tax=Bizionia argentinensis JUB59 TaxID=1046627 RepID=G2EDC9_9FLAO|nr:hypothetical protein [Bizionia argentinensis]EGV43582.2 hypothetical protein BZARG_2861 [Bizionia argentinensis JUB59]
MKIINNQSIAKPLSKTLLVITISFFALTACKTDNKKEEISIPQIEKLEIQVLEDKVISPEKDAYKKLTSNYELYGKWIISNSVDKKGYVYEIYKKGDEYIGVITKGDYTMENLNKKGNDYFIEENNYGEFYRIDKKMNMTLFDRDGDLTSTGYSAKKVD